MIRAVMPDDFAVLVHDVTTPTVGASTRFSKDDVTEAFPCVRWPSCFGCELWQPTDVTVPEHKVRLAFFRYHFASGDGRAVGGFGGLGCLCCSDADDEGECGDDGCCDASHVLSDLRRLMGI